MALTVTLEEVLHVRGTLLNVSEALAILWQFLSNPANFSHASARVDQRLDTNRILLNAHGRVQLDNCVVEETSSGPIVADLFRRIYNHSAGGLPPLDQLLKHPQHVDNADVIKTLSELQMSDSQAARVVAALYSEVLGSSTQLTSAPRTPRPDNGEGYLTEDSAISSDNLSRHASCESLEKPCSRKSTLIGESFVFRRRRPIRLARAKSSVEGVLRHWELLRNPVHRAPSRLYQLNEEQPPLLRPGPLRQRKTMSCHALNVDLDVDDRGDIEYAQSPVNTCRGPEFVVKSSLEPHVVTLTSNVKKRKRVTILLLDGRRVQLQCDIGKIKISQAVKVVIDYLSINANDAPFFGLATLRNDQFIFPRSDERILALAPDQYKSIPYESFTIYFRMKFYVSDLRTLRNESCLHLAYLQYRKDLLEQRWRIESTTEVQMSALALLVEFGQYNSKVHGLQCYFHVDHYLSHDAQRRLGGVEAARKVLVQEHRELKMRPQQAKTAFVEKILQLPNYGYHPLHVVEEDGIRTAPLTLLVGLKGVHVQPQNGSKNAPRISFLNWDDVKHIAHSKHHVIITLRSEAGKTSSAAKLKFCVGTSRCQEAFELLTSHQKMTSFIKERLLQADDRILTHHSNTETTILNQAKEVLSTRLLKPESSSNAVRVYVPFSQNEGTHEKENLQNDALDVTTRIIEVDGHPSSGKLTSEDVIKEPAANEPGPTMPTQNSPRKSTLVRMGTKVSTQALYRERLRSLEPTDSFSFEAQHRSGAYVVDASVKSEDEELPVNLHESMSDSLAARFEQLPRFPSPGSPAGPVTVRFEKDSKGSLGILVAQGVHGGVYVMGINPGGPADLQTDLKPGDRIVTVNGIDCGSLSYTDMVDFLRQIPRHVEMTVLKTCLHNN